MKHFLFATIAALTLVVSGCKGKEEPQVEPTPAPEPEAAIVIDGAYTDWTTLIANGKAVQTFQRGDRKYDKTALQTLMVYVDATDIYFMLNFVENQTQPLNLLLATKGETATDAINLWNPCYVDYRIEFGKSDLFVDDPDDINWTDWTCQQLMAYDHQKGGWNWTNLQQNIVTVSQKTAYAGALAIEGKMARENFAFTTDYFYIAAYGLNGSMVTTGALPAAEVVAKEVFAPEMLKVSL